MDKNQIVVVTLASIEKLEYNKMNTIASNSTKCRFERKEWYRTMVRYHTSSRYYRQKEIVSYVASKLDPFSVKIYPGQRTTEHTPKTYAYRN